MMSVEVEQRSEPECLLCGHDLSSHRKGPLPVPCQHRKFRGTLGKRCDCPDFVGKATAISPTTPALIPASVKAAADQDTLGHRIRPRPTPPLGHQRDPAPSRQSTQLTTSSRPLHQDRCVKPFGAKGIARKVGTRQRAGGGAGTAYATIVISTASVAAFTRD